MEREIVPGNGTFFVVFFGVSVSFLKSKFQCGRRSSTSSRFSDALSEDRRAA